MDLEITECGVLAPGDRGPTLVVSFDDAKNPCNALQAMACAVHLRHFRKSIGEQAFADYIFWRAGTQGT